MLPARKRTVLKRHCISNMFKYTPTLSVTQDYSRMKYLKSIMWETWHRASRAQVSGVPTARPTWAEGYINAGSEHGKTGAVGAVQNIHIFCVECVDCHDETSSRASKFRWYSSVSKASTKSCTRCHFQGKDNWRVRGIDMPVARCIFRHLDKFQSVHWQVLDQVPNATSAQTLTWWLWGVPSKKRFLLTIPCLFQSTLPIHLRSL